MSDIAPPDLRNSLFAEGNQLSDLHDLISRAAARKASRLLILAGKPVVCRIDGRLGEPLISGRVHFSQTEQLAAALLSAEQHATLDAEGAVEIEYSPPPDTSNEQQELPGNAPIRINVFYGDGAHNLVIFLKD